MTGIVGAVVGAVAEPEVRLARAWLSRAVEPGSVDMWRFVSQVGPVAARAALRAGAAPPGVQTLVGRRAGEDVAADDLRRADRGGGRLVVPEDDEWPAAALHCLTVAAHDLPTERRAQPDRTRALVPPLALWVRGERPLGDLVASSVALVGSRASTAYGEHVAAELAHGLGERGWTTVSGGAYGIDAAAHRGALTAEAPTVAVLACGVDRAYPTAHSALFSRILDDGLLVSEWPPGCAALQHRFLVRNRLIAALTCGTVVVEAAARSGALATGNRARDLGKTVMAVPGPVTSAMSVGCHELLRDTDCPVTLVTSAAEVVEAVGRLGADLAPPVARPDSPRDSLSDIARRVLDACPVRNGVPPDRLAAVAGCEVIDVLRVLPVLEVHDLVEWTGTGWRLHRERRSESG